MNKSIVLSLIFIAIFLGGIFSALHLVRDVTSTGTAVSIAAYSGERVRVNDDFNLTIFWQSQRAVLEGGEIVYKIDALSETYQNQQPGTFLVKSRTSMLIASPDGTELEVTVSPSRNTMIFGTGISLVLVVLIFGIILSYVILYRSRTRSN